MTRLAALARSFDQWRRTGLPEQGALSNNALAAFEAQAERNARRSLSWMAALLSVSNLAFWGSDAWVFRPLPGVAEALSRGRQGLLAVSVATGLALLHPRTPAYPLGFLSGLLVCFITASTMSALGGPATPWFHFLYTYALIPTMAWFLPLRRLVGTLAVAAACLLGYFGAHPSYLADPFAPTTIAHFFFVVLTSVTVGWFADVLRVRYFLSQRELATEREVLAARVEEATASLRSLALHLDELQDHERSRVARELHDELGQSLTALRLVLKTARDRYANNPAAIGPNLEQLTVVVQQITDDTRRIVRDMRPRVLDDMGLAPALEWLCARTEELGVRCALTLRGDIAALPRSIATAAFRCAQEALTNVLKHADATHATVAAAIDGARIVVTVEDDGVGFDPDALDGHGFGLLGMRERARALGGSITITPRSPRGTTLVASLPADGATTP